MSQTMNEILDRYVKERVPLLRKRTQADYTRHVATLRKHFGEKVAKDLTSDDLSAFMAVEKGKHQRNRQRAVLSAALEAAMHWKWLDYNIVRSVKRHPSQPRTRIVSDKEFALFRQKTRTKSRIVLAAELTRLTGLRQAAILGLRWDQVHENAEQRHILARHHITNEKIEVPITNEVQAVLNRCKALSGRGEFSKKKSAWVIPNQFGVAYTSEGFRAGWQQLMRAFERTGNDPFTFNDITKTGARDRKRTSTPAAQADDPTVARFLEFDAAVRAEATMMSLHYKVFYCLEKSIRMMITSAMVSAYGQDWWNTQIDLGIRKSADDVLAKEIDVGLPQRSDAMLDYTTFGQLRLIISQHWTDVFQKKLKTEKAVTNVLTTLNRMRGSIAHFSPLTEHEGKRLQFQVEEWFQLLIQA